MIFFTSYLIASLFLFVQLQWVFCIQKVFNSAIHCRPRVSVYWFF